MIKLSRKCEVVNQRWWPYSTVEQTGLNFEQNLIV